MKSQPPELVTWQLKESVVVPATSARKCPYLRILDPRFVGKATVFVSHAYSYVVADTFEVTYHYFHYLPVAPRMSRKMHTKDSSVSLTSLLLSLATLTASSYYNYDTG